ncbi:MAG: hypothetical protein LDL41_12200 [Coleofasciculus sp. S288]|nr:hypothetical protein [Coleofasciculus sp. S288]
MPKIKLLTSTTFALLLSAAFISPAIAQLPQEQREVEDNPRTGQQPGQPQTIENPDATPTAPQQNNPRSTDDMMLQQETQQRTLEQDGTLEQNTGQGQELQQRNVERQRLEQETIQRRTTVEQQPTNVETQPTVENQQQTSPTTTVEETPPVRALW